MCAFLLVLQWTWLVKRGLCLSVFGRLINHSQLPDRFLPLRKAGGGIGGIECRLLVCNSVSTWNHSVEEEHSAIGLGGRLVDVLSDVDSDII